MSKYLDIQGLKTYTEKLKAYINSKVSGVDSSLFEPVSALPTDISAISTNKIYLVPADSTGEQNKYAEYIYTGKTSEAYSADNWEKLGEYNAGGSVENNILTFDGVIDASVSVGSQGMVMVMTDKVYYLSTRNTFVGCQSSTLKYYNSWPGSSDYGTAGTNGVTPVKGKIYICEDKVYVYNGTALVQVSGGSTDSGEAAVAEIDIADIDLTGSIGDYVKGNKPSRLRVVTGSGDSKKVVGTLDITVAPDGAFLSETLLTQYGSLDSMDNVKDFTSLGYDLGNTFTHTRRYNISSSSSTPSKGTWSDWEVGPDTWTRDKIDMILDEIPEALTTQEITNAVSGILN